MLRSKQIIAVCREKCSQPRYCRGPEYVCLSLMGHWDRSQAARLCTAKGG